MFANEGPSFVQRILELVLERDEVRVVTDQRGRLTYAPDLADAALRLAGIVEPERYPANTRTATRPAYCVLSTEKIETALGITPRPFQAALDDFFSARSSAGKAQRLP